MSIFTGLLNTCDQCSPLTLQAHKDVSQRLRDVLAEAILMKDEIIKQNRSLAAGLRQTRRQLHTLRAMMEFAGYKPQ